MPTATDQRTEEWWLTRNNDPPGDSGDDSWTWGYAVWVGPKPTLNMGGVWDGNGESVFLCAPVFHAVFPSMTLQPGACIRIKPVQIERNEPMTTESCEPCLRINHPGSVFPMDSRGPDLPIYISFAGDTWDEKWKALTAARAQMNAIKPGHPERDRPKEPHKELPDESR